MTDEAKEISDLEQAPTPDEAGKESEQYAKPADVFSDEGAGPDTGEGDDAPASSPSEPADEPEAS